MRTARTNVRYSVCVIEGKQTEHDEAVVRVVEAKFCRYQPGKMIVYCNSTIGVAEYADMLGMDAYYSDADLRGVRGFPHRPNADYRGDERLGIRHRQPQRTGGGARRLAVRHDRAQPRRRANG